MTRRCGLVKTPENGLFLPWAQGVAGSNPVAPTRSLLGVTLSASKGRPDHFIDEGSRVACKPLFARLFVMSPHPNDLDGLDPVEDLIHKPVLNVDSAGTSARKIPH